MEIKDTVRVSLDLFEGPLDLLLHLIQMQRIDIAEISIASITAEYLKTIEIMREMDLDIAGEYLVMAATLILIKSRTLLPPSPLDIQDDTIGCDPREGLIERLKQYQIFREAGRYLQTLGESRSLLIPRGGKMHEPQEQTEWTIDATLVDLLKSLRDVIRKQTEEPPHLLVANSISVREKMLDLVRRLAGESSILVSQLFKAATGKYEAVVIFLAILELIRIRVIQARQRKMWGEIRLFLYPGTDLESWNDG
ncbi:segregation/condensation protein A [bacterium]|nr:segregation/condensation protein A [candidate division CSSED10-310 bacterium]